jgi:hypothetical protein
MSPFWPEGELRARPLPSAVAAGADRPARSPQFAFWPFATFRGDAAIRSVSERSGHSTRRLYSPGFMSTRPAGELLRSANSRSRTALTLQTNRPQPQAPSRGTAHSCLVYSLDYFVGGSEQGWRNGNAERLCRLEINDKLEFGRLFDRQIAVLVRQKPRSGFSGYRGLDR